MQNKILITGGAGFIGSHLADKLLQKGHRVRVLDNLCPQVHGRSRRPPAYLNPGVEFMEGDLRQRDLVKAALHGVDVVFHLAAAVGVGQSMYEVEHFISANDLGTAVLMECLAKQPVSKLVVASSMSIYGEGLYVDEKGKVATAVKRSAGQLQQGAWNPVDENGKRLTPIPTPEFKNPDLSSIYALSKYDQERMCLLLGQAYGIPTVALRFFNVYGRHQSLSNPYTGVIAIFASRLLNRQPPRIFEDGEQRRDFVHVSDVAQACYLAMESSLAKDESINVGSGNSYSILEIAKKLAFVLKKEDIEPEVTGLYRVGDIRHCFSDSRKAELLLGYRARVDLQDGLEDYSHWLKDQIAEDHFLEAQQELQNRGLAY
jgi:dTDP-L-rhamnose 4-epimerase